MFFKKKFHITDTDKEWVHESFEWLLKAYGYPSPDFSPFLFTDQFFPLTIAHKQTAIEPLLADLCTLFKIDPSKVSFEIEKDISDSYGTPYQMDGTPFECELELIRKDDAYHYKLYFANSLLRTPKRLVFNAVFQFIQIDLSRVDSEWAGSEDHEFLFYLIGIYTGWGVILAQTMIDIGRENDGLFWQTSWKYVSPMPVPLMAYGMALHASMIGLKDSVWKAFLPPDIRGQFEKAVEYIDKAGNQFYDKQELMAIALFKEAEQLSEVMNFDKSIETYQKALFLTNDEPLRSIIFNNIGYMQLFKNDYEKSIFNFQKALQINPDFAYANDNLGFAYIMTGELDTGRHYLMLALASKSNEHSYSYRNMALYHQKRGEAAEARLYFQKALGAITFPVDWLEYYYACFLFEQGEKEEALTYLQLAVEKGEPQAIKLMREINEPS